MLVDSAELSGRKRSRRSETKLAPEEQQSHSGLMPAGWLCLIITVFMLFTSNPVCKKHKAKRGRGHKETGEDEGKKLWEV